MSTMQLEAPSLDAHTLDFLIAQRQIIPRETIYEIIRRVTPVVRVGNVFHRISTYCLDVHDPRYLSPQRLCNEPLELIEHSVISTLHRFGSPGIFMPTIAESVIMFPLIVSTQVIAFETVGPATMTEFCEQKVAIDKGFHVAKTILYTSNQR